MSRRDTERLEARIAVGAWCVAAILLVVALIADASGVALVALLPLALGAAAMFDAWRRSVRRTLALEAAVAETRDDLTRAASWRSAAEGDLGALREASARHDAEHQQAQEESRREIAELEARAQREGERHGAERERLVHALRRAEEALDHQRELAQRLAQSRRAEREWNRELRGQIQRLYDARETGT